jgi:glycosyltransferase involved in cell wall biosynthesis
MSFNRDEPGRLGVEYRLVEPLPAARTDLPLLLRVVVRNIGAATWPNQGMHPINLSYHWFDPLGRPVDFEGLRALLPTSLRPGEAVELELQVEPPPSAGAYLLALDMVEEGVAWFSLQGVAPLTVPVEVAATPNNLLRVCIVNGNCVLNDALGNNVVNQLRFFEERGYQALALLEHIDLRVPAEIRRYFVRLSYEELRQGPINPQMRRGVNHFYNSDIYVFNYSSYYALAQAMRLVSRGVLIFDYHGITPPHLWEGPGVEDLIEGQRHIGLVRYADYAIAHSGFTRAELLQTGAIDAARVYQMPYVVPLERFRPGSRDAALLARYGLTADQPTLLYVGRMAGNKRIDVLIQALAFVREHLPHAVLLLVGETSFSTYARVVARARTLAETLGIADGVIFAGQVPDEELVAHYQLADVFVTASLHEGFCIPVLEAMACGVPVVGAHATALPETIGEAGLTFRPEDPADLAAKLLEILNSRPITNHGQSQTTSAIGAEPTNNVNA